MPCEDANGLLPGRGARSPSRPAPERWPWRGMPCDGANGLLPGRGAPGRAPPAAWPPAGRGAPGRGALPPGRGAADWAAGAASAGAAGAAGAGAAGAAGAGVAGAAGAGAAASAAGFAAAGLGAAGRAAGAAFAGAASLAGAAAFSAGAELLYFSRIARSTGASSVEDADRTNSPAAFRSSSRALLVTPSSLASSCTRTFATSLLSWPSPRQGGPSLVLSTHRWGLIGCPSASDPLPCRRTWCGPR